MGLIVCAAGVKSRWLWSNNKIEASCTTSTSFVHPLRKKSREHEHKIRHSMGNKLMLIPAPSREDAVADGRKSNRRGSSKRTPYTNSFFEIFKKIPRVCEIPIPQENAEHLRQGKIFLSMIMEYSFHMDLNHGHHCFNTNHLHHANTDKFLPQINLRQVHNKALYGLKCNTCTCRHIKCDVITTYYPKPNPNHKKGIKCGPRNLNPNYNASIRPKIRRIAALGLGLGFLG